jgi:hypothetical protein
LQPVIVEILQHLPEFDREYKALQVVQVPAGEHKSQRISVQQYKPDELRVLASVAVEVHAEHLVALSATVQSEHFESEFKQQAVLTTFMNPLVQCKYLLSPSHLSQLLSTMEVSQQNKLSELTLNPVLQEVHFPASLQSAQLGTVQQILLAAFKVPLEQLEHVLRAPLSQSLQLVTDEEQQ